MTTKTNDWLKYCQPENWHEAATIYPMMAQADLEKMAEDIKKNGLQNPVTLIADKGGNPRVLDGRNRLFACRLANIEPSFTKYAGKSPVAWVISLNSKRRHLTAGQLAFVALRVEEELAKEAEKRVGGRPRSNLSQIETGSEEGRSARQAAELVGASNGYVSCAKRILAEAPDLVAPITSDARNDDSTPKMTIPKAIKIIERRKEGKPDAPRDYRKHKTAEGHTMYDLTSLLQKAIRRGLLDLAIWAAVTLDLEGFVWSVWKRLLIIVDEDIDPDDPDDVAGKVLDAYERWEILRKKDDEDDCKHPERLALLKAVRICVRAKKSRLIDNLVSTYYNERQPRETLPDWVYDMHTKKGRDKGRGVEHFFDHGAHLENKAEVEGDAEYEARARATLLKLEREGKKKNA
jgi:hypothetical protein